MDTIMIKCFETLAEMKSYRAASECLFISTATLSRNIKALEQELNIVLFNRTSRKVELSPAGKIIHAGLKGIQDNFVDLINQAQIVSQYGSNTIKIGMEMEYMPNFLPYATTSFESMNKDVYILLLPNTVKNLNKQFRAKNLDIVIGNDNNLKLSNYSHLNLEGSRLGMCISIMHPLAHSTGRLSLRDFKNDVFATLPDDDTPARQNLFERCKKAGFTPKHIYSDNMATLLTAVETNRAVSLVYEFCPLTSNKHIKFIEIEEIERPQFMIFWDSQSKSRYVHDFIGYIESYYLNCFE